MRLAFLILFLFSQGMLEGQEMDQRLIKDNLVKKCVVKNYHYEDGRQVLDSKKEKFFNQFGLEDSMLIYDEPEVLTNMVRSTFNEAGTVQITIDSSLKWQRKSKNRHVRVYKDCLLVESIQINQSQDTLYQMLILLNQYGLDSLVLTRNKAGELKKYYGLVYDAQQREVRHIYYKEDGTEGVIEKYFYEEAGNCLIKTNVLGEVLMKKCTNGNKTVSTNDFSEGRLVVVSLPNGLPLTRMNYTGDDKPEKLVTYEYD